jgi:hypothetical protein
MLLRPLSGSRHTLLFFRSQFSTNSLSFAFHDSFLGFIGGYGIYVNVVEHLVNASQVLSVRGVSKGNAATRRSAFLDSLWIAYDFLKFFPRHIVLGEMFQIALQPDETVIRHADAPVVFNDNTSVSFVKANQR